MLERASSTATVDRGLDPELSVVVASVNGWKCWSLRCGLSMLSPSGTGSRSS